MTAQHQQMTQLMTRKDAEVGAAAAAVVAVVATVVVRQPPGADSRLTFATHPETC